MPRQFTILLFLTIWLVYLFHFNPSAAGSGRFVDLTMSLVEQKTINVDSYHNTDQVDIMPYKRNYYIDTNPGLSFFAAPVWALVYALYRHVPEHSAIHNPKIHYLLAHFISCAFTTALLSALTSILLARIVFLRSSALWRALLVALLYAFGTTAFFLSTRLNQNIVIAFLGLVIFSLVYEPKALCVMRKWVRYSLLGFTLGIAIFIDLSILPFLFVLIIPVMLRMAQNGAEWRRMAQNGAEWRTLPIYYNLWL